LADRLTIEIVMNSVNPRWFALVACLIVGLVGVSAPAMQVATAEPETSADSAVQDASDETTDKKVDQTSDAKVGKKSKKKIDELSHFLRVSHDKKGRPVALQTSVTRYMMTNDQGDRITVDLAGVVHIGEKEYYEQFNKRFEDYDGLLYELVAPEGTVIPKGGRTEVSIANPLAAIQKTMQEGLGLEFQLEHIDYTKSNFVHADMSPEEFGKSMKANEESVARIMFRAMGQSMAMQSRGRGGGEAGLLLAMFSKNKTLRLRRVMAEQMKNMEGGMIMFEGKEGSTIIDHRNAKVMEILRREIASGKKNLAIFYGAGHLPDMQRRLMSEFQMQRGGQYWLDAWKLTNREQKR